MNTNLDYLLCCITLTFITLSIVYQVKFNKLKHTGKIPNIIGARQRQIVFFLLAILSALVIIID